MTRQVRATCTQLIGYCAWNEKQFDCCDHFATLETEVGTCYTINSLHSSTSKPPLQMISNRHTGPGKLELHLLENTQVYLHGADEVPFINHPLEEQFTVELGQTVTAIFLIREIVNDPFLESVSVEQRACRWASSENFLSTHVLYSYSTCIVDCRARAQMEICSCVSQFMPRMGGFPACDLNGLICLQENKENFNNLRLNTSNAKGLACDCMASCDEPEINIVETLYEGEVPTFKDRDIDRDWSNGTGINSKITIKMESLPMEQYIRKLVRSPLELIVSIGGIIGLFLGLSMIDVIELIHYICIKGNPYITCR
ncbi:pickpocket protein 19-like isoform X1 [Bemisia tabaci]|uniref:pickpocket protein 19-like isoform X1 n=1 Tax=Bemisia tabaci TaxID=7038 RepID=UPI003B2877D7